MCFICIDILSFSTTHVNPLQNIQFYYSIVCMMFALDHTNSDVRIQIWLYIYNYVLNITRIFIFHVYDYLFSMKLLCWWQWGTTDIQSCPIKLPPLFRAAAVWVVPVWLIHRPIREWCHLYAILIELLQQKYFQYISIICSCCC